MNYTELEKIHRRNREDPDFDAGYSDRQFLNDIFDTTIYEPGTTMPSGIQKHTIIRPEVQDMSYIFSYSVGYQEVSDRRLPGTIIRTHPNIDQLQSSRRQRARCFFDRWRQDPFADKNPVYPKTLIYIAGGNKPQYDLLTVDCHCGPSSLISVALFRKILQNGVPGGIPIERPDSPSDGAELLDLFNQISVDGVLPRFQRLSMYLQYN